MGGGATDTGMTTPGGLDIVNALGYDPSQTQPQGNALLGALGKGLTSFGEGVGATQAAGGSSGQMGAGTRGTLYWLMQQAAAEQPPPLPRAVPAPQSDPAFRQALSLPPQLLQLLSGRG